MRPLLDALQALGARYECEGDADIPFTITGPMRGGKTSVSGVTSQFLSSLLLITPLLQNDSTIHVERLNERPYVELTCWWLDRCGITWHVSEDFKTFTVAGNQRYSPDTVTIPSDFSSATFGAVAAAICGTRIELSGLDFSDPQGDKKIFAYLESMGAEVTIKSNSVIVDGRGGLQGTTIDLNRTPDALPSFAVAGCVAGGTTHLVNVPQARVKETDRITVMSRELRKMGASVEERDDGMSIHRSPLTGTAVNGESDHRIVMALALAGMVAYGDTVIDTAESAQITYPHFVEDFVRCGADITVIE
jgi:3-phosphoshikimate 1-carboxyvinyltransferase